MNALEKSVFKLSNKRPVLNHVTYSAKNEIVFCTNKESIDQYIVLNETHISWVVYVHTLHTPSTYSFWSRAQSELHMKKEYTLFVVRFQSRRCDSRGPQYSRVDTRAYLTGVCVNSTFYTHHD
jgi:hypothetical protein